MSSLELYPQDDGAGDSGILEGLNERQVEAVTAEVGPVLVVAGAGSGKTRVLTRRIAYLISRGVSPGEILAITFTNKAADEMADRVAAIVDFGSGRPWVATFHSTCARMLREQPQLGNLKPGFSIYDADDSRRLIERTIRSLELDTKRYPARAVLAQISLAKANLVGPDRFGEQARGNYDRMVAAIYRAYEEALAQANAVDFDNLINLVVAGLASNQDARLHWQRRFRHILVDEFQDTNLAQSELIYLLSSQPASVFAVGDSDQSIYGFRGASVANILEFERRFPGAKVIALEQNYRSTNNILSLANALIARNTRRHEKHLWSELGEGQEVCYFPASDDTHEAMFVTDMVSRIANQGVPFNDIAIIYRTNAQSRRFEEQFVTMGVPYRVVGGVRFYERREVKDLLSYMRLVANPADEIALTRIINVPRRGIGAGTLEQIISQARLHGMPPYEFLIAGDPSLSGFTSRAAGRLKEFRELIEYLRSLVELGASAREILEQVITATNYREYLQEGDPIEAESRLENVNELIRVAEETGDLQSFLEQSALLGAIDEAVGEQGVAMMTAHGAKGLEFQVVFVVGLEDGIFPHMRSLTDPQQLEEERRLFYVAVTRAKQRLYLTSAAYRSGGGFSSYYPESRFLGEVPQELFRRIVGSDVNGGISQLESLQAGRRAVEQIGREDRKSKASGCEYTIGDKVFHARYGEGQVVGVDDSGREAVIEIKFPDGDVRKFLIGLVKLKKIC
jgi:DNA helicase-2/ATP-dependent DNA helicase PcrA